MIEQRNSFIQDLLITEKLDALLIFGLPNIRYLSGFTGTDGVLLIVASESVFLTDSRYLAQAQKQVSVDRIHCYKNKLQALADELSETGSQRVGFDGDMVSVSLFKNLSNLVDTIDWCPLSTQLQSLRGVKTPEELIALKAAANLNQQAFAAVLPLIQPGITEREIALELEFALKRLGGEANAFDFIVASGARGALPHGVASEKKLFGGDLVTIDFGTRVDGYHSDETVTLAIGKVDRKLRQIFDIVLEAHDSALAAIQPNMAICDLDVVARDFIAMKGYGEYFGHSLGHGVGLEVHEYPAVSSRSEEKLLEGMVITVEPGIYIPDLGGVRIEDTVVVTAGGFESLTKIPKQFKQIDI
ncbi:MAG: aminopeptidase P family protein [Thermodesulfobacteriota bacterium]|nr:aminopeptidase P family protein [Thermodesulfobacteriota bacterium]